MQVRRGEQTIHIEGEGEVELQLSSQPEGPFVRSCPADIRYRDIGIVVWNLSIIIATNQCGSYMCAGD